MKAFARSSAPPEESFTKLGFAQGPALVKLINDSYSTLVAMILEQVQNSIDAEATSIGIIINQKTRGMTFMDDGEGISREKAHTAFQHVMQSGKTRDKLGQFGMGLFSTLAKCEWSKLISCAKGSKEYWEWTFNTKDIRSQTAEIHVPLRLRPDLRFRDRFFRPEHGVTPVEYRTMVEVHNYTDDRYISKLPSARVLFDEIVENYREKMLQNNVKISITIIFPKGAKDEALGYAEPYQGLHLPKKTFYDGEGGNTSFNLYLARKGEKGYEGKVSVGEADNPFRLGFKTFCRSTPITRAINAEVIEALSSGVFEGDILTERAKLHSNRKSFYENSALIGFCNAMETWYEQEGKAHYQSVIDAQVGERYKVLGDELRHNLQELLKLPEFAELLREMKEGFQVLIKTPGQSKDEPGTGPGTGGTVKTASSGGGGGNGGGGGGGTGTGTGAKPPRRPPSKDGPQKIQALGINFSYDGLYTEEKLWEFEEETATLYFNSRHPKWLECEKKGMRALRQLQEVIAIQAIVIQTMPDKQWRQIAEIFSERLIGPFTFIIQQSPAFQHIGRKKSTDTKE